MKIGLWWDHGGCSNPNVGTNFSDTVHIILHIQTSSTLTLFPYCLWPTGVRLSEGKLSGLVNMSRWGDATLETKYVSHLWLHVLGIFLQAGPGGFIFHLGDQGPARLLCLAQEEHARGGAQKSKQLTIQSNNSAQSKWQSSGTLRHNPIQLRSSGTIRIAGVGLCWKSFPVRETAPKGVNLIKMGDRCFLLANGVKLQINWWHGFGDELLRELRMNCLRWRQEGRGPKCWTSRLETSQSQK